MHDEHRDAIQNMILRATLTANATVDSSHVRGAFSGRADEAFSQVPMIAHYGFHAEPLAGASAILAALGGRADRLTCLGVDDPRYRPNLGAGAVALYNSQGNIISLVQQTIRIVSGQPIAVTAPSMTINGRTVQTA